MPSRPGRVRAQVRALVVNLILTACALAIDWYALGDRFSTALVIRLSIVSPLLALAIALNLAPVPRAVRSTVTAFALGVSTISIAFIAQYAETRFAIRYLMIVPVVLFTVIIAGGVDLVKTRIMTWAVVACYAAIVTTAIPPKAVPLNLDLLGSCAVIAGLGLMVRKRRDLAIEAIVAMREAEARRVAELREANLKLAHISNTDALTGLFNRRYLDALEAMSAGLDARPQSYAILMIDIDHFKLLNDSAGHVAGDRCLRTVAATIARHLPSERDTAVRYGGEEFCVILPDTEPQVALRAAETMRSAIEALRIPNPGLGADRCVTASVGLHLALATRDMSISLQEADAALYEAKRAGRNRVAIAPMRRGPMRPKPIAA